MGKLKTVLASFVALLPISAIAQGPSSALRPETGTKNFAALNKKALAGDTRSQLQLGIAFEFGHGVDKNLEYEIRTRALRDCGNRQQREERQDSFQLPHTPTR